MTHDEPTEVYPLTAIPEGRKVTVYLVTEGGEGLILGSASHADSEKALKLARLAALRTLATLVDDLENVRLDRRLPD